jgi:hypothetical protein
LGADPTYTTLIPGQNFGIHFSCSADDLDLHLSFLETDSMGLSARPASAREAVIAALMGLQRET